MMRLKAAIVLALLCVSSAQAAELIVSAGPKTAEEERNALKVPPGFEVQLVASEPDINKPINLAFDDRGRLWVTNTVDYPFPAPEGSAPKDSVKILEDFGPDGKARKITTYADRLDIPVGVLPMHDSGALVYSIPYIWKLTDASGSGKADRREKLLGEYGHRDTHGQTGSFNEGFDGWIYAVHGYLNTSTITASDGSSITMNSGNTYRFRPDGSHVEYYTHGQVNPFGLTFDPLGNIFTSDCETKPIALLLRGAYYPSFGKPDDGLGFAPDIVDHFYGSTAIAGLCEYVATQFPEQYRNRMFVGNVVTNKINNAHLRTVGSGVHGDDEPDFLVSSDAWFRPSNIKLGPDGALYVADFYNRIIGHYEVDLHHPGRDRERGRIWRIVYKGEGADPAPSKPFDLSKADINELIDYLASPNFTIRMLAMNRIADVVGSPAIEPLKQTISKTQSAEQKVHALWVLYRLHALDDSLLAGAAHDASSIVREHTMRILGEVAPWKESDRALAVAGPSDADPLVRRTATEAVGRHPEASTLAELLAVTNRSDGDPFIAHTAKIALRDEMMQPEMDKRIADLKLSPHDELQLANAAVGAKSPAAAAFLLNHVTHADDKPSDVTRYLKVISRSVPASQIDQLAELVRTKFRSDVDLQRSLLVAVLQGLQERGITPDESVRTWGNELTANLLEGASADRGLWTRHPIEGAKPSASPWGVQIRKSADGDAESAFLSSLVHGETLTGTIRSQPFPAPASLSMFVAGHDGRPGNPPAKKNLIRVCDAASGLTLASAAVPRNDVARKVTLDLSSAQGKPVYLEAVDGLDATAYAWLAVGRFDPPVVRVPMGDAQVVDGLEIARSLKLNSLGTKVESLLSDHDSDVTVRVAAARTLGSIEPAKHIDALAAVVGEAKAPDALREAAASALASLDIPAASNALVLAMQTAPQKLQTALAQSLASGHGGAEALLDAIEHGKASARLLLDSNVSERLSVVKPNDYEQRIKKLTQNLPTADVAVQRLIDQRAAAFKPVDASAQRGRVIYDKSCAVCHSLGGQGAHVGPPLDGIGVRGIARLCEDILDPSRNVAAEFRQNTFVLSDGNVVAGIPRRTEGQSVVIADATGKEVTLPKSQITRQVESKLSLMPSNFGDAISSADFNDLLSYLLTTKDAAVAPK